MNINYILRAALNCAVLVTLNASVVWSARVQAQAATNVVCSGCVGGKALANNAVVSGKIKNSAVTAAKIRNNAVTSAKILNNSVTGADIQDGSIRAADIANGSIAFEDLAVGARAQLATFAQTVVVRPVGGDEANCIALYAAHDAITDAAQRNHYLLYIEPGIYDCRGLGPLTMKEYVDIMGAGRDATLIVGDGETISTATVIAANHTSLRNLELLNQSTGGAARSQALLIGAVGNFSLSNVRLNAIFGSTCFALVTTTDVSAIAMDDIQVKAGTGCALGLGIDINLNSTANMNNVDVEVSGSSALSADGKVTARNSRFKGVSASVVTSATSVARFASSQLDGSVTFNGGNPGSIKCVGSYDGNFDALDAACQ